MDIPYTKAELIDEFQSMTATSIVQFLQAHGVTLKPTLQPILPGIYRRVHGVDMFWTNGKGMFNKVGFGKSNPSDEPIQWCLMSMTEDEWVRVLDIDHKAVSGNNREILRFDRNGIPDPMNKVRLEVQVALLAAIILFVIVFGMVLEHMYS